MAQGLWQNNMLGRMMVGYNGMIIYNMYNIYIYIILVYVS